MKKIILVFAFVWICVSVVAQTKSFTFVFLNNKPDKEVLSKEKSDSIMQGHMDNIGRLAKEGKLLAAGPFEGGGGIFILNTTSLKEANEWLATDPGIQAKRWNLELFSYTPTLGSVCSVEENFEMVFYQFVRFNADASLTPEEKVYLQKLNNENSAIHSGVFGDNAGGILVLKPDVIVTAPKSKNSQGKIEIKKLYIAKGSFCEK